MFDFEKLDVYKVAKQTNVRLLTVLNDNAKIDVTVKEQLKKAGINIVLYLTEGTGRFLVEEKKHFLTLSRNAVFECTALLDISKEMSWITESDYNDLYSGLEQLSKMLLGMFRSQGTDKN